MKKQLSDDVNALWDSLLGVGGKEDVSEVKTDTKTEKDPVPETAPLDKESEAENASERRVGRPRKNEDHLTCMYCFYILGETDEAMRMMAVRQRRTYKDLVHDALERYIEEKPEAFHGHENEAERKVIKKTVKVFREQLNQIRELAASANMTSSMAFNEALRRYVECYDET